MQKRTRIGFWGLGGTLLIGALLAAATKAPAQNVTPVVQPQQHPLPPKAVPPTEPKLIFNTTQDTGQDGATNEGQADQPNDDSSDAPPVIIYRATMPLSYIYDQDFPYI